MNTNKLKAYAPKARVAFMDAVKNRAAKLGIFEDHISDITIDGDSAIIEKEIYTRKQGQQRNQLVKRIEALGTHDGKFDHTNGFNQFINETAFTWFNRLTAVRYMEVNEYLDHGFRVLSKAEGAQFGEGFEILNSAADVSDELGLNKDQIIDMVLDGNKEEELYRTLLLGQCHQLSEAMPFMFEKLDDATELLLPDNLTKTDSILKDLVNDIPEDNWQEIEVIGWLYQFYISEHKDAVIGKVVKREDIPAATQLFTPNWIVKYLVQNSLGRQWLATYPDSELKDKMEYYITPAEQSDDVIEQLKAITPTSIDPEGIKVLDPACGSGHILVEVYEVLREIYLERGYRLREIPELILTKNIYGLDIDDRAAQMAAFAVLMKAREDDKRIFSRDIKMNIHSIQSTENININQLWADLDLDGNNQAGSIGDLFAEPQLDTGEVSEENKVYFDLLCYLNEQFIDAKNLGSLIEVDDQYLTSLTTLQEKLAEKELGNQPTAKEAAQALLPIINQGVILATKYDVAVANPPYMGSKGMNAALKDFAKKSYPNSKSDLFAMFIERGFKWLTPNGFNSMVTMQSWMFLSSFEKMRDNLLNNSTIETMLHMGNGVMKIAFGTNATVFQNRNISGYCGSFSYCENDDINERGVPREFPIQNERLKTATSEDFNKIPGSPIAYWIERNQLNSFTSNESLRELADPKAGMSSTDNEKFLRLWHELDYSEIEFNCADADFSKESNKVWYPFIKGGSYRKWYGNQDYVINWYKNGKNIRDFIAANPAKQVGGRIVNEDKFFRESISWSRISSGNFSTRYYPSGFIFSDASNGAFPRKDCCLNVLGFLNSETCSSYLEFLSPTVNFQSGEIAKLPLHKNIHVNKEVHDAVEELISISKVDWDLFETSWKFTRNSIVSISKDSVSNSWDFYTAKGEEHTERSKALSLVVENAVNDAYKSENPTNFIKDEEITLNQNIKYRYRNVENAALKYRSETICELLSYFVGNMMGRYSLDREGLVYAHSRNEGFKELATEGAYKTFSADDDGIVPLADEDWVFEDDATTRFREFVKTVWGKEHLQENLDFVAESLCLNAIKPKKGESSIDTIRRYFSNQFYKDHLKTYKKRPIYWLFSSGKAKAFECLVYLHRYNEGTLSRMRTEYVTPLMGKLESRKNILEDSKATASGAELRAIDKELKIIDKKQAELVTFDEELKHLAEMKISLDLDDGVKVNYGKFGNLLADVKAIHGKNPEVIK
ncbi:BREX-1 system adenine-specific DNA-methyltransferase PglX [Vibrio sp. TMPB1044]|uniref:BREX-1 system adenine-specific DNA-methyltransferase PglX n=1 Tax=Vibrio sp. TMPB1044 TaxID=3051822 RepID=UPI00255C0E1F|nr:BREX-1 system adenine-specific DNA-methyltransferase PglX [Vibrio sp. TMPB1044]MDL5028147.1 BREX-1 system adenine-specific DNA-methyltransferase PglX [Vibrio sp. TMPB1044]MDN5208275.1 BREX-1 system adenine-specific DNA-methyltransferase PglX [Vibrio sp. TMPB1044]